MMLRPRSQEEKDAAEHFFGAWAGRTTSESFRILRKSVWDDQEKRGVQHTVSCEAIVRQAMKNPPTADRPGNRSARILSAQYKINVGDEAFLRGLLPNKTAQAMVVDRSDSKEEKDEGARGDVAKEIKAAHKETFTAALRDVVLEREIVRDFLRMPEQKSFLKTNWLGEKLGTTYWKGIDTTKLKLSDLIQNTQSSDPIVPKEFNNTPYSKAAQSLIQKTRERIEVEQEIVDAFYTKHNHQTGRGQERTKAQKIWSFLTHIPEEKKGVTLVSLIEGSKAGFFSLSRYSGDRSANIFGKGFKKLGVNGVKTRADTRTAEEIAQKMVDEVLVARTKRR